MLSGMLELTLTPDVAMLWMMHRVQGTNVAPIGTRGGG